QSSEPSPQNVEINDQESFQLRAATVRERYSQKGQSSDFGLWPLDMGLRSLDFELWTLDSRRLISVVSAVQVEKAAGPTKIYFSSESCIRCHEDGRARPDSVCQLTEVKTWKEKDKHPHAYTILEGPRATQMGKLLGYDVKQSK